MTTSDARARVALSLATDELQQTTELLKIVKTQWEVEHLRAELLQDRLDLVMPVVKAARELVKKRNERYPDDPNWNPSNPDWWQGYDWSLVSAVDDYEWKLKQSLQQA